MKTGDEKMKLNDKTITIEELCDLRSSEAKNAENESGIAFFLGKTIADYPCTITCYREKEEWKSAYAAFLYYSKGAEECDGSEAERYQRIADFLYLGAKDVTDEEECPTEDMARVMGEL